MDNTTPPSRKATAEQGHPLSSPHREKPLRRNFTMIPNLVFNQGLSPYALRLYAEIRKVAGDDGECYLSTASLSTRCCMSAGAVSAAKKELLQRKLVLLAPKKRGRKSDTFISPPDIWQRNDHEGKADKKTQPSSDEYQLSPDERQRSPGETNNIQGNKIRTKPFTQQAGLRAKLIDPERFIDAGCHELQAQILNLFNQVLVPRGYLPVTEATPKVLRALSDYSYGPLEDLDSALKLFTAAAESSPPPHGENTFVRCVRSFWSFV